MEKIHSTSRWVLPPDDVLLEILSKLPVKSLLRLRHVSRSWRALISDRHSHKKLPPAMAGLFNGGSSYRRIRFLGLGSRSYVDPASIDAAFSFLPSHHRDRLFILNSCSGLFLLSNAASSLVVCNPATRRWTQVPSPPASFRELALAFDPRQSRHYKVVSFPMPRDHMSHYGPDEVHVFSSETGEWKKVVEIRGLLEICITNIRILFFNGMIHVLDVYFARTFVLDLEEKECRLIRWPTVMPPCSGLYAHCFGLSSGLLHFAFILSNEMHVWVVEDSGSHCYVPKHRISVRAILNKVPGNQTTGGQPLYVCNMDIVAFHSDLDLIFLQIRGNLYSYCLVSTELMDMHCNFNGERPFFAYSPCFSEDVNL